MTDDTRPAFSLATPLFCRRCEEVAIVMPVVAVQNERGEIHIIEVAEKGHYCMNCDGVRTVRERPPGWEPGVDPTAPLPDEDYVDNPPRSKSQFRRQTRQHDRAKNVPVTVKKTTLARTQAVECTECTWMGIAKYLIEGRCPNCNGYAQVTAKSETAERERYERGVVIAE